MRYHLGHPTQHAACGTNTSAIVVTPEVLAQKPEAFRCKRCLKVQAALEAGRRVYAGHDDGRGDQGARKIPTPISVG